MGSGIARGRVRKTATTTTTVESRNMAAILHIIGWQRHACYDQLTPVKTKYLLTSITWPYRGLKFTTHQGHVFWSWPLTECWISIGSRAHVRLTCYPTIEIYSSYNFFFYANVFLLLCFVYGDYKIETENLTAKLQNSNQNSTFSWVSLIGLWTT